MVWQGENSFVFVVLFVAFSQIEMAGRGIPFFGASHSFLTNKTKEGKTRVLTQAFRKREIISRSYIFHNCAKMQHGSPHCKLSVENNVAPKQRQKSAHSDEIDAKKATRLRFGTSRPFGSFLSSKLIEKAKKWENRGLAYFIFRVVWEGAGKFSSFVTS